jgi:apolipoprotein N-acyltransferase
MRGVEDGFSIARAAKNGFLTVSDDRGRIVAERSSSSAPFATLLVNVQAAHGWTVYQLLGDWFAWVAMALLMFVMMQMVRLRVAAPTGGVPSLAVSITLVFL